MFIFAVIAIVILLPIIVMIMLYNGLIGLKNRVDATLSGIDVQLKRRYDLIPNLVETVKGYAAHEKQTLTAVIEARGNAMSADGFEAKASAENMVTGALKSLFALSEQYPNLKADAHFMELQRTLSEIEQEIQSARLTYNDVVRELNTACETFPSNIIAGAFGFTTRAYFTVDNPEERRPVNVKF